MHEVEECSSSSLQRFHNASSASSSHFHSNTNIMNGFHFKIYKAFHFRTANTTTVYFLLFITLNLNYMYMDWTAEQHFIINDDTQMNTSGQQGLTVKTLGSNISKEDRLNFKWPTETRTEYFEPRPTETRTEYFEPRPSEARVATDLFLESVGLVSSVLVIVGLYKENRFFLVPWIVILPLHTLLDLWEYVSMVSMYLTETRVEFPLYVVPGLILSCINMYVYLVVFSQFQEYWAGRGTAAYEALLWQNAATVRFNNSNMANIMLRQQQNHSRSRNNASDRRAEQYVEQQRIRADETRNPPKEVEVCPNRLCRRPSAQFCQKQLNRNQDKLNRRGSSANAQRESMEMTDVVSSDGASRPSVRFDCEPSISESPSTTQSQTQSSSSNGYHMDERPGPSSKAGYSGGITVKSDVSANGGLKSILTNSPKAKATNLSTIHVTVSDTLQQITIPAPQCSSERLHI